MLDSTVFRPHRSCPVADKGFPGLRVRLRSHPLCKIVASKLSLVQCTFEGKSSPNAIGWSARHRFDVFYQSFGMHRPLVNLDYQAVLIDEKRCGNTEVSATIE